MAPLNTFYTSERNECRDWLTAHYEEEMEGSGTARATRNEEGNEKYEYFFPLNDPETVLLIDH